MLVAAAVPLAMAHNDTGQPGAAGNAPSQGATSGPEVFGTYYGASGFYVNTADPVGQTAGAIMLCDMEVQNVNPSVTEATVDGNTKSGTNAVPDGTFDDGGQGGACHTQAHYGNNWDSPGCSDLNNNGNNDHVGGQDAAIPTNDEHNAADTFVLASCDSETRNTEGLVTCVANAIFGDRPEDIVEECPDRVDPGTPNPGSFIECGGDASGDFVTTGYVDNDATKAKNNFPAPTFGSNCQQSDSSLALFVVAGADSINVKTSVATTGWVGTLNK